MTIDLSRRSLLALGTFGLGASAIPGAAAVLNARGFTHSVASGEPGADTVLLWTRYVPAGRQNAKLSWQVSPSADFGKIAAGGDVTASGEHDWCVKPVVTGLEPNAWYFYRFTDAAGRHSEVGRTRTLPAPGTLPARFTLGVFSCSNLPFGWFNAYGHAAARDDIDLMVHLGDYLYEYERGKYPGAKDLLPGRVIDPASEILHLADYRLRYASYRRDPDLQSLHRLFPMIDMWDDHESANDSWKGGAENHQPATEGDWQVRKAIAARVYCEWMPVSDADRTNYRIGDLADIFRPETRLTGRDQQLGMGASIKQSMAAGMSLQEALIAFRDTQWLDPSRSIMGAEQERWLADGFAASVQRGACWQVLAQQTVMGMVAFPKETQDWLKAPGLTDQAKQTLQLGLAASAVGLPFNMDNWDGYPRARERLFASARAANANLVVLSGDSHNAWAFDHSAGKEAAGVEFAGQSVTSPGYESSLPMVRPDDLVAAVRGRNPALKWANFSQRGYFTTTLTPGAAIGEWQFLDTIRQRSTAIAGTQRMTTKLGSNRLEA